MIEDSEADADLIVHAITRGYQKPFSPDTLGRKVREVLDFRAEISR